MSGRTKARWAVGSVAAVALVISVACGGGGETSDDTPTSTPTASTPTAITPATSTPVTSTPAASTPAATGGASEAELIERGREIYFRPTSCVACHGDDAKGLVGPDIIGKTADDIAEQLEINDAMQFLAGLPRRDLEAIEAYLASLKE